MTNLSPGVAKAGDWSFKVNLGSLASLRVLRAQEPCLKEVPHFHTELPEKP